MLEISIKEGLEMDFTIKFEKKIKRCQKWPQNIYFFNEKSLANKQTLVALKFYFKINQKYFQN